MPRGGVRPGAGRPKGALNNATKDIRSLAQEHGAEAIATLVQHMRNKDNPAVSKDAAKDLLDRGFGKPGQHVEIDADVRNDVLVTAISLVGKSE